MRSTTLRAVYMDLVTDLGDAGLRWGFLLNLHGAPTHNEMLDHVAQYFSDTFGGRMVHLTGLASVAGAVPRDIFSADERKAEGNFADLVSLAKRDDWTGYFGTPAIATPGARAMNAIAQASIDVALKVLDGAPDAALPRVAGLLAGDPDVQRLLATSTEHEARVERRQNDWLSRKRP